ncbi:MAG: HAMP domain-containing histidine kinase [Lachnospiraceae bacterium]|nr:HAMP domain-containing histidine kinase [Lachnospiraceae bacterium]
MKLKSRMVLTFSLGVLFPLLLFLLLGLFVMIYFREEHLQVRSIVGSISPEIRVFFFQLALIILMILILTWFFLVSWVYRTVITPIKNLSEATRKIADGTLDFTIDVPENRTDEIADLCGNFESMRKRLEDTAHLKLEEENENRTLISNISHDLKTPVTSIKGYAEGIIDGVADTPEKMNKYVRTIYTKAEELDGLINELTFYAGIDTNKIPYDFAKIDITEYFNDCVDEIRLDLNSKGIELNYSVELPPGICIIADPVQIKKVINNIIGNSIKYMDKEHGIVSIRLKDADAFVIVEIRDNGKGIAAKDLPYIFDRFYRSDASRSSSKGGSGIGLSIVKKIVEDHGGRVWAESGTGNGTAMIIEFRKFIPETAEKGVSPERKA